ncbi:Virginiamycin B lyase [compost metagenome]
MRHQPLALAAAIVLGASLVACKEAPPPPEVEQAPRYELATVMGNLSAPRGLAIGPDGFLLSTTEGLTALGPEGQLRVIAPVGQTIKGPAGLALAAGSTFLADPPTNRIYRMLEDGALEAFAGTGTALFPIGDGGLAISAQLDAPFDVKADAKGALFIADTGHHRIRRVDTDGRITTVAGNGLARFEGDGGAAKDAALHAPVALNVGADGSLYVADTGNHAIRRIAPDGAISTVAGNGVEGFAGDGGPAASSQLASPSGVVVLPGGDLLVSDTGNHRIRWIRPGGAIWTVAGNGKGGHSDEADDARRASIDAPEAIALAPDGSPFFVDTKAGRLYQLRGEKPATPSVSPSP